MISKRLAMGAIALASIVGMAAGPVASAGAGVTPSTTVTHSSLGCASCTKTFVGSWHGNGTMTIAFKDIGEFGDSFRATYSDKFTSPIRGNCSVSSLSSFKTSLRVHIPSTRNFKIKVSWCRGPGDFPAGFVLRTTP